jgi:RNA-directed DNA polymerase
MGTANQRAQRRYHGEATYRLIRYADDCAPRTLTEVAM